MALQDHEGIASYKAFAAALADDAEENIGQLKVMREAGAIQEPTYEAEVALWAQIQEKAEELDDLLKHLT
jgi:hypothetical protein